MVCRLINVVVLVHADSDRAGVAGDRGRARGAEEDGIVDGAPAPAGDASQGAPLAADGVANQEIARQCGVDSDAVRRWRARFALTGVDGVGVIAKGRGRKASLPDGMVAEIVRVTCH